MNLSEMFLLFIFYSMFGWIIEVIQSYIRNHKFINRGFLIGPYCPIYGFGGLAITLLLRKYLEDPLILFFMSVIICSILEYSTSYIMEKIFKARWWDYSNKKFNIDGRICLETMVPFGILGLIMSYFINPIIFGLFSLMSSNLLDMIAFIIFIIFVIDNVISFTIISNLKDISEDVRGDSTERVTKKVRKIITRSGKKLYNRIIKAFPTFRIIRKK